MEKLQQFIVMVALWAFAIVLVVKPEIVEGDYDERGIEVTATITEVMDAPRFREYYTCTYYNDEGREIRARLVLNRFDGEVGQVVIGKYLPETPELVHCEASDGLMIGLKVAIFVLAIFVTLGFIGNNMKD